MSRDQTILNKMQNELSLKQLQITSLLNITQAINENLPQEELFSMYKSFLTWELSIEKLALYIRDDQNWQLVITHQVDLTTDLEKLPQLFIKYNRLHTIKKDDDPNLQSFEFIIPVYHKTDPIAYSLISGVKKGDDIFNNIQFITSITNIVAVAIENKRLVRRQIEQEKEWELAKDVTQMLIPNEMPSGKNFSMANVYRPHYKVGGDYIDYIWFSETKICFCIADVSGKGIAAAMIMANFQALLQNLGQQYKDLETLVMVLNQAVMRITKGEKYLTFFIAVADLQKKLLYYVNAGHIPPVLYQNGNVIELKATTTIIGHFEQLPEIKEGVIKLEEGTVLVAYTDGLTDLKNKYGENFSQNMLKSYILDHKDCKANEMCDSIMEHILNFKGNEEIPDDIAIVTFKFSES
ncbi:MAG: PP2C family protein-serine/threonine phosphatase [Saprospiraceae bacterium]|nr:PP2C family protein-serine/threonine phosphatase [Saprospiraceae bacterium]MBK8450995.1 PP2C family protein-serine/threonine phosphatase [Saprospiraceae bacterium]MBK9222949.1 PP2C family protein-serine/threonine phosphatase [Saprospiraceae bacterium]MBK9720009.1 PP2C family protein-serine/threonine phosphatase [Saprospiraceae bacterium]MBK9726990.1 PP2C family protein-serine/threonine phosphatase [Saprospiraceae bacterium]